MCFFSDDYLADNLEFCTAAISKVHVFEQWLTETVVEQGASHLLRLEKVLLDLAATTGVSAGVYYHLAFEKGTEKIARYFESGLYDGAMEKVFWVELPDHHPYCINTKSDIECREHDLQSKTRSISEKRKKQGEYIFRLYNFCTKS